MYRDRFGLRVGGVRALVQTLLKMPKSLITFTFMIVVKFLLKC